MTANAHIAIERLSMLKMVLASSGWTANNIGNEICWLPPEHLQSVAASEYGAGHLHVWDALSLQARADLTSMATLAA